MSGEEEEFGYNPVLPATHLSDAEQDVYSLHLPRIEPTTTAQGVTYQMSCSCGWSAAYAEGSASRAGREYDQHLKDALSL